MQTATDTVRDLTAFVFQLCGLGVAAFMLLMIVGMIAAPFAIACQDYADHKERRAKLAALVKAKEADELKRKASL